MFRPHLFNSSHTDLKVTRHKSQQKWPSNPYTVCDFYFSHPNTTYCWHIPTTAETIPSTPKLPAFSVLSPPLPHAHSVPNLQRPTQLQHYRWLPVTPVTFGIVLDYSHAFLIVPHINFLINKNNTSKETNIYLVKHPYPQYLELQFHGYTLDTLLVIISKEINELQMAQKRYAETFLTDLLHWQHMGVTHGMRVPPTTLKTFFNVLTGYTNDQQKDELALHLSLAKNIILLDDVGLELILFLLLIKQIKMPDGITEDNFDANIHIEGIDYLPPMYVNTRYHTNMRYTYTKRDEHVNEQHEWVKIKSKPQYTWIPMYQDIEDDEKHPYVSDIKLPVSDKQNTGYFYNHFMKQDIESTNEEKLETDGWYCNYYFLDHPDENGVYANHDNDGFYMPVPPYIIETPHDLVHLMSINKMETIPKQFAPHEQEHENFLKMRQSPRFINNFVTNIKIPLKRVPTSHQQHTYFPSIYDPDSHNKSTDNTIQKEDRPVTTSNININMYDNIDEDQKENKINDVEIQDINYNRIMQHIHKINKVAPPDVTLILKEIKDEINKESNLQKSQIVSQITGDNDYDENKYIRSDKEKIMLGLPNKYFTYFIKPNGFIYGDSTQYTVSNYNNIKHTHNYDLYDFMNPEATPDVTYEPNDSNEYDPTKVHINRSNNKPKPMSLHTPEYLANTDDTILDDDDPELTQMQRVLHAMDLQDEKDDEDNNTIIEMSGDEDDDDEDNKNDEESNAYGIDDDDNHLTQEFAWEAMQQPNQRITPQMEIDNDDDQGDGELSNGDNSDHYDEDYDLVM